MEMTNEELQKLLTSFEQEVGNIKQWEIDRKDNLRAICKDGGISNGKKHLQNRTGLFSRTDEKIKSDAIKGGKIGGAKTASMGYLSRAGKISVESPNHVNNKRLTCPHCNKEGGYTAMKRHHMDRCKHRII